MWTVPNGRPASAIPHLRKPVTIHLIRHGEGHHNAGPDWSIYDAELTDLGRRQARAVKPPNVQCIISSPMTRAIQTTQEIWKNDFPCPVMISPLHSERFCYPCDGGRPKDHIEAQFPAVKNWQGWDQLPLHWTPNEQNDWDWKERRVPAFTTFIRSLGYDSVAVVGHGCFFAEFLAQTTGNYIHLANCQIFTITMEQE